MDRVEISIDGKDWIEAEYAQTNGSHETGEFIDWRYEIKSSQLGFTGNHTVHVRAVSGDSRSIADSDGFYGRKGADDKDDEGLGAIVPAMITALILLLVIAFLFHRRRK